KQTFSKWSLGIALAVVAMSSATAARQQPPFSLDPYPSTYQPLPRTDTIIVNVTILDGGGQRIDNGEVLMREGRIVAVGHQLDRKGAAVIDGGGRWLTPGVIDIHSHNGTFPMPLTSLETN